MQFGKWQPDFWPNPDGLVVCHNLIPSNLRYQLLRSLSVIADTQIDGTPLTIFSLRSSQSSAYSFVASSSKVYRLSTNLLTDISKTGGYAVQVGDAWDYTIYGTTLILTNNYDPIQKLTDLSTGTLSDLGGTPPIAKYARVYKDHLVLGHTTETVTDYPRRVYRSAKGNIESWNAGVDGCGFYDLPSWGERIVGLEISGDYLVAYLEGSIYLISYVGAPWWFNYDRIYTGDGPLSVGSIAVIDNQTHIILTPNDVYALRGTAIQPVGAGIRSVLGNIDFTYAHRITNLVSHKSKVVMWSYVSKNAAGTSIPNKLLIYNYEEDRFSEADYSNHCLGKLLSPNISIDALDDYYTTIDEMTNRSFNSAFWGGGHEILAGASTSLQLCSMDGPPLPSQIKTGQLDAGQVVMITQVRPHINRVQGTVNITVNHRNDEADEYQSTQGTMNNKGLVNLRASGRFMQFVLDVSGEHDGIVGGETVTRQRGAR